MQRFVNIQYILDSLTYRACIQTKDTCLHFLFSSKRFYTVNWVMHLSVHELNPVLIAFRALTSHFNVFVEIDLFLMFDC